MDWISVSERLPADNESVLVLTQYSDGVYGSGWANYIAAYSDGEWREDVEYRKVSVVTHWMPVPPDPPGTTGTVSEPANDPTAVT